MKVVNFLGLPYFILALVALQCSTIEFIPDYDYVERYDLYSKKNWSEVEVHTSRPKKPFRILGTVVIRNFEGNLIADSYREELQKELFLLKVDGVWLSAGKILEVEPLVIRSENHAGLPVAYYESNKSMAKITGFVFRYKK